MEGAFKLAKFDFVVTSYAVVRSEHRSPGKSALFGLRWWRVVLDEAHAIKNSDAAVTKACYELRAAHRLIDCESAAGRL